MLMRGSLISLSENGDSPPTLDCIRFWNQQFLLMIALKDGKAEAGKTFILSCHIHILSNLDMVNQEKMMIKIEAHDVLDPLGHSVKWNLCNYHFQQRKIFASYFGRIIRIIC